MINCTCCGKEISEEATRCPHCGQPTAYKKAKNTATFNAIYWIIAIIVLCAIIG